MLDTAPAYRDGNVLRWLGAYTSSVTGDVVFFLALSWAATKVTGPAGIGLLLAVGAVPRAVLMLAGGVVADRVGPRLVLIGSDAVRCAVVLAVAALAAFDGAGLWTLFALAAVFGAVDALFMPAVGALPPLLTAPTQLARVQAMRGLAVRASNAVGPLVGAWVLAAAGTAGGFGAAGVLFAASLGLILAVRTRPSAGADRGRVTAWADLVDGLRYLRSERRLSRLVVVIGLSEMCFSGPVFAGLVLLTAERHWTAGVLGWLLAAFSLGGAASGLLLTVVNRVPRAGVTVAVALGVTACLVTLVGLASAPGLAVALCGALGVASGITGAVSHALLQQQTEARYLGRVTSVLTLCTLGLGPVLYPVVGLVTAAWGAGTFFAGCGVVCALATLTSATQPVRTARLLDGAAH